MIIVGVDPGKHGAIAFLSDISGEWKFYDVKDMPVFDDTIDGAALRNMLNPFHGATVVLEKTQPMPKNGSQGNYWLGYNTGGVAAAVQALSHPLVRLRPAEWKKTMGLIGKDKKASIALARELYPACQPQVHLVKHADRAEAILIAEAYRRSLLR